MVGYETQYTEKDISPYFWVNGTLPKSEELSARKGQLRGLSPAVGGLVENPREFSYAELKAMPKQEQITKHFCIQGWSGVAKWGGVPMRRILDIVKPTAEARYAVFYSFAKGSEGGVYYDVHTIQNMRHGLTLLAYEMNGAPLNVPMEPHYGCDARTSWASRWSSGSRPSSSCMILPTLAPAKAVITKITNSMEIACRFDPR